MNRFIVMACLAFTSVWGEEGYFSQAGQDRFVQALCGNEPGGYYLEIGAGHPTRNNNTFFLEQKAKWKGVSIDLNKAHEENWKALRKNPYIIADATTLDYQKLLESFPPMIDYLSLDIDEAYDVVLERLPLDKYKFKAITIEHDAYRFGNRYRDREREILHKHGYLLICADVHSPQGKQFEDWWVHPTAFSPELLEKLKQLSLNDQEYEQIISLIRKALRA